MSGSEAVFVTVSCVSSSIVRFDWIGKEGAEFTSVTVTVKLLVALNGGTPLSVTTVVRTFVPGPWLSLGIQEIIPFASMLAPAGALGNE